GRALVQDHHDIRPQGHLNLYGALGGNHVACTVEMGLEAHAFLTHTRQGPETKHLKTPAVGENGGWPGHEGMQATKAADEVVARAEEEVVGVAQNNTRPTGQQVAGAQRFDRGLGANRHEYWGIEGAMRGVQLSQTCLAVRIGVEELEGQWHAWVPASAVL